MPDTPRALIVRAAGTNCDAELARAFELAGAVVRVEHVRALIDNPEPIDTCDLIGFPGGFSFGDDIASGRILAMLLRERLYGPLRRAAERGVAMIGVCNGFQALVQVGLLPGPGAGEPWPHDAPPAPSVALAENNPPRFQDRWVGVIPDPACPCVWTRALLANQAQPGTEPGPEPSPGPVMLPIAHGEGRFVPRDNAVLHALEASGRVALRYADNPNGSAGAVAGICDTSGRIFGLMPHPERALEWTRHPFWTRLDPADRAGPPPGLAMFTGAVEAVRAQAV